MRVVLSMVVCKVVKENPSDSCGMWLLSEALRFAGSANRAESLVSTQGLP